MAYDAEALPVFSSAVVMVLVAHLTVVAMVVTACLIAVASIRAARLTAVEFVLAAHHSHIEKIVHSKFLPEFESAIYAVVNFDFLIVVVEFVLAAYLTGIVVVDLSPRLAVEGVQTVEPVVQVVVWPVVAVLTTVAVLMYPLRKRKCHPINVGQGLGAKHLQKMTIFLLSFAFSFFSQLWLSLV